MHNPDTVWITIRRWHSYARRLERRHLRQDGVSWSATTIAQRARACIVEIQTERIRVRAGGARCSRQRRTHTPVPHKAL